MSKSSFKKKGKSTINDFRQDIKDLIRDSGRKQDYFRNVLGLKGKEFNRRLNGHVSWQNGELILLYIELSQIYLDLSKKDKCEKEIQGELDRLFFQELHSFSRQRKVVGAHTWQSGNSPEWLGKLLEQMARRQTSLTYYRHSPPWHTIIGSEMLGPFSLFFKNKMKASRVVDFYTDRGKMFHKFWGEQRVTCWMPKPSIDAIVAEMLAKRVCSLSDFKFWSDHLHSLEENRNLCLKFFDPSLLAIAANDHLQSASAYLLFSTGECLVQDHQFNLALFDGPSKLDQFLVSQSAAWETDEPVSFDDILKEYDVPRG